MTLMSIVASARVFRRKNLAETALYERTLPVALGDSWLRSFEALRARLPPALEASGEVSLERAPGGT
jgi:hypothetical protein